MFVVNAVEHNWEKQLPENVLDPLNAARKKKGGLYSKEETKKDAAPEAEDAKGMCMCMNVLHGHTCPC